MNTDKLRNKLIGGDCLEVMEHIDDNSIDLIFLDPPFNLKKNYEETQDNMSKEDYLDWQYRVIDESNRILKNTGNLIYYNIPKWSFKIANYADEMGMIFHNWIAWDTSGSVPAPSRLYPKHYSLLWFSKSKNKTFNKIYTSIQRCRKCGISIKDYGGKYKDLKQVGEDKVTVLSDVWLDIHRIKHKINKHRVENELPLKLMFRIVGMWSNKEDIILDPFVGSGTTIIACLKLNREFIGIDINEKYLNLTAKRINKYYKGGKVK